MSEEFIITQLGLGTWGLGGEAYGAMSEDIAVEILELATDLGVSFVDTSPIYGSGFCEKVIGSSKIQESAVIATKIGLLPHGSRELKLKSEYSHEAMRQSLNSSLERLGTSSIDVLQFDSLAQEEFNHIPSILDFFNEEVKIGRILDFGFSLKSPYDLDKVLELCDPKFIQVNFSLMDQRILETPSYHRALKLGTHIIARTPLHYGYLVEDFKLNTDFNYHLGNWPSSQLELWSDASNQFRNLAKSFGLKIEELAMSFIKSSGIIQYVIPGSVTPSQLENISAAFQVRRLTGGEYTAVRTLSKEIEKSSRVVSPYSRDI